MRRPAGNCDGFIGCPVGCDCLEPGSTVGDSRAVAIHEKPGLELVHVFFNRDLDVYAGPQEVLAVADSCHDGGVRRAGRLFPGVGGRARNLRHLLT